MTLKDGPTRRPATPNQQAGRLDSHSVSARPPPQIALWSHRQAFEAILRSTSCKNKSLTNPAELPVRSSSFGTA
jgi:hypothetical protein